MNAKLKMKFTNASRMMRNQICIRKYYCRRRQLLTEPSEILCCPRPAYLLPKYVAHLIPPMDKKKKMATKVFGGNAYRVTNYWA